MIIKISEPIILSRFCWDHIPCWRAYHRDYPELRGEAQSSAAALEYLERWLIRARDADQDRWQRESLDGALKSLKDFRKGAKHNVCGAPQRTERVAIEERLMKGVKMVHCQ